MSAVTIPDLPDDTRRALDARAARNGRSTEAEIIDILEQAVRPAKRIKLGSEIVAMTRPFGGVDLDIERDRTLVEPPSFESAPRRPRALRGRIQMAPDFDETPADLIAAMEGEAD